MGFLIFLAVLSLLVFVHEAGHFFMAKRAGIRVLEFGFGLPPRVYGKKIGDTIYSINLLPVGGFVRLFGEEEAEVSKIKKDKKIDKEISRYAFFAQSKKVRAIVIVAGVVMNFLLGVVLFSGLYTVVGIPTLNEEVVQIIGVSDDEAAPANKVFEPGDQLIAVDAIKIESTKDFQELVNQRKGEEAEFGIIRNKETLVLKAAPREEVELRYGPASLVIGKEVGGISCVRPDVKEGPLGIVVSPGVDMIRYPLWQMPFRGAYYGLLQAYSWGVSILSMLGQILAQAVCGAAPEGVGGPIEIGFQVSKASKEGMASLLTLVAILSVNLAVINILPIPALDGGRLLFICIEAVTRRRINARVEHIVNAIGMAFLLALILLLSVQDVLRRVNLDKLKDVFF